MVTRCRRRLRRIITSTGTFLGVVASLLLFSSSSCLYVCHAFAPAQTFVQQRRTTTTFTTTRTTTSTTTTETATRRILRLPVEAKRSSIGKRGVVLLSPQKTKRMVALSSSSVDLASSVSVGLPEFFYSPLTLAWIFCAYSAYLGFGQLFHPVKFMKRRGYKRVEPRSVSTYFIQKTGFANIGTAVAAFLATTSLSLPIISKKVYTLTVQQAIGYGILTRFLFIPYGQIRGLHRRVAGLQWQLEKVKYPLLIFGGIMCVTGFYVFDPTVPAKIVSIVPFIYALLLYTNTEKVASQMYSKYAAEHTKGNAVQFSAKTVASSIITSSILTTPMAFGVDPITCVGYSAAARAIKLALVDRFFVPRNLEKPYTTSEIVGTLLQAIVSIGILVKK